MTTPGIPNHLVLSTSCFGARLKSMEDQAFAAVAMGFRQIELGLADEPVSINGISETHRETGMRVRSVVAGCLKPRSPDMVSMHLGSPDEDQRERAVNSIRRHIRLAQSTGAPVVVVRGTSAANGALRIRARELDGRLARDGLTDETRTETVAFTDDLLEASQPSLQNLCRSLHGLMMEFPETRIALEPGFYIDDLLSFEAMGWVLDDLSRHGLGYWHDVGRIHIRERAGLPSQGQWLERYSRHMLGVHLQDASEDEVEMPPGLGEVEFKLIGDYLPADAARVVEIHPRHGRGQILESIQFLVDQGF